MTPDLVDIIDSRIARALAELHTMMPGEVKAYDATRQVASVLPLLRARERDEEGTLRTYQRPMVVEVPIVWPGGGGHRSTHPLREGDTVAVFFSESALERWLGSGDDVDPGEDRRHHISDAIAVPGLYPNSRAWSSVPADASTFGSDTGPQVVARQGTLELGSNAQAPATEQFLLGTTYRGAEASHHQALGTALDTAIGAATAATTAVATAAPLNAVPVVGGLLSLPSWIILSTQLGVLTGAVAAARASLAAFEAQSLLFLSQIVKGK